MNRAGVGIVAMKTQVKNVNTAEALCPHRINIGKAIRDALVTLA